MRPDKGQSRWLVFIWSNDGQIKAHWWARYDQWYPMVVTWFFVGPITALYWRM